MCAGGPTVRRPEQSLEAATDEPAEALLKNEEPAASGRLGVQTAL